MLSEPGDSICWHLPFMYFHVFKKNLLYVIVSNLCRMYTRTISLRYQFLGALWPKLAAQADFVCWNLLHTHLRKNFCIYDLKLMSYTYAYEDNISDASSYGCIMAKTDWAERLYVPTCAHFHLAFFQEMTFEWYDLKLV